MSTARPLTPESAAFYVDALNALDAAGIPHLVGGAYALERYTGIARDTKDADIFLRAADVPRALETLAQAGYRTELPFPHWLGKAHHEDDTVDLIFGSGNGIARVDDAWFEHARDGQVLGRGVRLIPPEEMIWSKSFVMERERYDGADIAHVIRATSHELDWDRLLARAADHWRVLLAHLVLFGFVYPGERDRVPARIMRALAERLDRELDTAAAGARVCGGTLISRQQYLIDIDRWGYEDARLLGPSAMSPEEVRVWTRDIGS